VTHLHVVTAAVTAVALVAERQVRVLVAKYRGESLRRLVDICSPESDPPGGSG
jgi:hypothetical protein